jgi:glyoxylase-like metal-dependent hydrolase (beta-lactamase superfamily II)
VRRILAPNPGIMTGPGTNTYVVGDDDVAVIDPGPDDPAHLDAILAAVGRQVRWILVTHTHVDHSPLAAGLRTATGAPVLGFGPAPTVPTPGLDAHDQSFQPDREMVDGDRLETADFRLTAVHTPGHASNHLCFELAAEKLLFSGDHVMQGSTVVIAPLDGDMTLYLESLDKVRRLGVHRIAPGHGEMIEDAAAVLDEYLRHRLAREAAIRTAMATADKDHPATVSKLVETVYVDVPAPLHPIARYSVWAHLRRLAAGGQAATANAEDIEAPWWPTHPKLRQHR